MTDDLDSLRERLRTLRAAHEAGELDANAYEAARRPLERDMAERMLAPAAAPAPGGAASTASRPAAAGAAAVPAPRPSGGLAALLAGLVLALAVGGYAITGTPGAIGFGEPPESVAAAGPAGSAPTSPEEIDALLEKLAARLREQPDDATGWTLLARAYAARGRLTEAAPAFREAMQRAGDEPDLLADLADVLTAQNNGAFTAEARQLVGRALARNPDHPKSLALAGSAAYDDGDFAGAVRHWGRLEAMLPADSPLRAQVASSVAQARQAGNLPAGGTAGATGATPPAPAEPPTAAAAAASAVSGEVRLDPSVAAQARPDDAVFVLARPADGSRMPLAVLRRQVKDLPLRFTLDDSMAMAPTAKISGHARVQVVARISRSGQATPQPGDLTGESTAIAPGTAGVDVRIDRVVGP